MSNHSGALQPATAGRAGFLSADAARVVADAEVRSSAQFHIATFGIDGDGDALLRAIIGVLRGRTRAAWAVSTIGASDLVLVPQHRLPLSPNRLLDGRMIVVLRDDEAWSPGAEQLSLPSPISVMNVMELLDVAAERLTPAIAPRPEKRGDDVAPFGGHTITDGSTLASALARLVAESHYKRVRVRVTDFGVLWLCFGEGRYRIDFAKERLAPALRSRRFVLTAVSEKVTSEATNDLSDAPLSELLWMVGLVPCVDVAIADDTAVRLQRWPNFPRLPHTAEHLQLCGLLNGRDITFARLVAASALPRETVKAFMTACILCQFAVVGASARNEDAAPVPRISRGGFFERLRRSLGL